MTTKPAAGLPITPEWFARFFASARPDYHQCASDYDALRTAAEQLRQENERLQSENAELRELLNEYQRDSGQFGVGA